MLAPLLLAGVGLASTCTDLSRALGDALSADRPSCGTHRLERLRWKHRGDPCLPTALEAVGLGARSAGPRPPPPEAPPGSKEARNAYLPLREFSQETENFAIRWGDPDLELERVDTLAARLEEAWALQTDDLGWPLPVGTERYKLNVYVDETNAGPPDTGTYVAGYYNTDPQGQPMLVIGRNQLLLPTLSDTVQHEFHHAVQGAFGTFEYADEAAWWFEADATWMEHVADSANTEHAESLGAFARHPELTLGFYDRIDEGVPLESYAYGAFIFPRFLELAVGDVDVVREVWERSRPGANPLKIVDSVMADRGQVPSEWFGEFVVRNATWDYPEQRTYRQAVRDWEDPSGSWPSGAVGVPSAGRMSPSEALPSTFGANYWEVVEPPAAFQVNFSGGGGPGEWVVAVAGDFSGEQRRTIATTTGAGTATVVAKGFDAADEVWLVVAAVDGFVDDGAVFDYSFTTGPVDSDASADAEEPGGCGCDAVRPTRWWSALWSTLIRR
ncbi:MAG: hypothetical protein ACI8PZ_002789 [Myxococcota bacterium]|jgi:hypothetical protein